MGLWLAVLIIAAFCAGAVFWPFLPPSKTTLILTDEQSSLKTALKALERDAATGVLSADDAAAQKIKLAQSFKQLQDQQNTQTQNWRHNAAPVIAAGFLIVAFIISGLSYKKFGHPHLGDQSLSAVQNAATTNMSEADVKDSSTGRPNTDIQTVIATAEDHLAKNPQDAKAWELIAPLYAQIRQWDKAGKALSNAAQQADISVTDRSDMMLYAAQAYYNHAGGTHSPDSLAAIETALQLDPNNIRAVFLDHFMRAENAEPHTAITIWDDFITRFEDVDSQVENQIVMQAKQIRQALLKTGGVDRSTQTPLPQEAPILNEVPALGHPDQSDIAAAAEMSQDDRTAMVAGMVASLAAKLEKNPQNLPGWERLIRSYTVLDDKEAARTAYSTALETFTEDNTAQNRLSALSQELGL